jgi:protein-S-isoprenylcysteine O-methyltransferase Ste14
VSQRKSRRNKGALAPEQPSGQQQEGHASAAGWRAGSPEPARPVMAPTTPVDSTVVSGSGRWITDRAWLCGLSGALAVVLCAVWYNNTDALNNGLSIAGWQVTSSRIDTLLAALIMCSGVMVLAELTRLWLWHGRQFLSIHPDITERRMPRFFGESLLHYGLNLGLLALVIFFFRTAGEYGYAQNNAYYQAWFRFLEILWVGYLWGGLPYVIITRALKYTADAERRDLVRPWLNALLWVMVNVFRTGKWRPRFDEYDKKALRALLVKLFFAPLMTVFFVDQFPHLVNNVGYVFGTVPDMILNGEYAHRRFNRDFFNISVALVFSVDVALAWCGYVVSSRWVDNQTTSAEPTMLGWVVCLVCYPPFQMFLGLYYGAPGEREILGFANQWLVTIFSVMMVLSYLVYMSGTLWFGVRFSNLTNRGIIRTGPYSFIRHPAYASKNFAWWCIMFPVIVYNASHSGSFKVAVMQTLGLLLMTWVYYLRAITEERHLSVDPAYVDYCKQVRYRFIPGVI